MISPAASSGTFSQPCFETIWSRDLHSNAQGLSLARERGWLLTWDKSGWLYLLDHKGNSQAERQFPGLSLGCAADDASAYAIAGQNGEIWWLAPDLVARWEKKLSSPILALALDPFGQYLVVSDKGGTLHLYDRFGQTIFREKPSRPLCYLAFVPAAPVLVGSADFGLVVAYNVQGELLWRDGLVASVGGLSTDGAGKQILLACFSEGLHVYQSDSQKKERIPTPEPSRLVDQSFEGRLILCSNLNNRLVLLNQKGNQLMTHSFGHSVISMALGPLGKGIFVALASGPILRMEVPGKH